MPATADITLTQQELDYLVARLKQAPADEQRNIICQDLIRKLQHRKDTWALSTKAQLLKGKAKK
jgi:hypothetical protein